MALPRFGVSNYHKRTQKKRPGRHAKHYSKRIPSRKRISRPGKIISFGVDIYPIISYIIGMSRKITLRCQRRKQ